MDLSKFQKRSSEASGYYVIGDSYLHFVPKSAVAIDSDMKKGEAAILILGTVCSKYVENDGDKTITVEAGQTIGVWFKPGMRELKGCCGQEVVLQYTGKKDVGKPEPMHTFDVRTETTDYTEIPVLSDRRNLSKTAKLPWD